MLIFLQADNLNRPGSKKTEEHLQAFLGVVRSLGVSLRVYKVNDKWEWTSLLGGEKKILLRKLPDYFDQILPAERVKKTRKLWVVSSDYCEIRKLLFITTIKSSFFCSVLLQNFRELLESLNKEGINEDDITTFKSKVIIIYNN